MMTVSLESDMRGYAGGYAETVRALDRHYPQTLAEAVELAVNQLDAACLQPVADGEPGPIFQARTMLGLLTFYYALQVYSSAGIAAQLGRELKPSRFNEINVPEASLLKRFRAENRAPLVFCLRSALMFLAQEKVRQGVVTHVKRAHMNDEANRRIIMAMFTDSLEEPEMTSGQGLSLGFGVAIGRDTVH